MKYLLIMFVMCIVGCSSISDLEKKVVELEETNTQQMNILVEWINQVNSTLTVHGQTINNQGKVLKMMNADGVRVQ